MATILSRPTPVHDAPTAGGPRWEVWLLRGLLMAAAVYALLRGDPRGAVVPLIALALSFLPILIGARAPRPMEAVWVVALTLPAASDALGVYDHVTHWGKLVHGVEGGAAAALAAWMLLGFSHQHKLDLPTQLAGLASICVGITVGAVWEFYDFLVDWVWRSDLQKSNADTMTDMLWADLAAGVAALLAVRIYYHTFSPGERTATGAVAERLFSPLGQLLERHGKLMLLLAILLLAAFIASLWFTGRPVPGLPID